MHQSNIKDDRERFLLAQLKQSGKSRDTAVAELYKHYGSAFQRFFERQGVVPAQAEELVQEVFIKIIRGAANYRGESAPSAWLWSIVRNTLISYWRSQSGEHNLESIDDNDDSQELILVDPACPVDMALNDESLVDCVRREFERFAQDHAQRAQTLALIVFNGWKPQDVAVHLGRTAAAAREYLSQCRKLLRPFLERCRELIPSG